MPIKPTPLFSSIKSLVLSTAAVLSLAGCQVFSSEPPSNQRAITELNSRPVITDSAIRDRALVNQSLLRSPQANQTALDIANLSADPTRHEYTLKNGLKVIIKEDHRAPVVMTQIWYKVGATDEPDDKGGISHLLEHMMFKGTDKVSGADFDRLIAKFGGDHNAFTSYDYTGYYEMFPVNRLDLALELEADRMTNLKFDSPEFIDEFTQEKQVVMEERRQRTDDNPLARAFEAFRSMALPQSPKGESVIGPMDEIASIGIDDLQKWYEKWYTPNNAVLVIVGDVNPQQTLTKVKRYYNDIPSKPNPVRPPIHQPPMQGYQQTTLVETVNVPTLLMAYNVPTLPTILKTGAADDDVYDLLMLQFVLDGGFAARFETSLVRDRALLASIGSSYDLYERGDALFLIQATPREEVSLGEAQVAIIDEIERLKSKPISDEELERARSNAVKGFVFAQDSMAGQAQMIGSLQARGLDDRIIHLLPKKLEQVSSEDIHRAAQKYLVRDNLTVMYVAPNDTAVSQ